MEELVYKDLEILLNLPMNILRVNDNYLDNYYDMSMVSTTDEKAIELRNVIYFDPSLLPTYQGDLAENWCWCYHW